MSLDTNQLHLNWQILDLASWLSAAVAREIIEDHLNNAMVPGDNLYITYTDIPPPGIVELGTTDDVTFSGTVGLTLRTGSSVNHISNDADMAANLSTSLVTEFAAKGYVDNYTVLRDGTNTLTGDWDFGSFTISGTGDIHCNDLYTSGSTIYIGDNFRLKSDGSYNLALYDSSDIMLYKDADYLYFGYNDGQQNELWWEPATDDGYFYIYAGGEEIIQRRGDDKSLRVGSDVNQLIKFNYGPSGSIELQSGGGNPRMTIAYSHIDFHASTISGTGDIYCDDLYASGSTVHIGDYIELSDTGSALAINAPVESTGLTVNGSVWYEDTYWDDIRVPSLATRDIGTRNPDIELFKDSPGLFGVYCYHFDPDNSEEVHFTIELPHGYKEGTDIYPHVHWAPTTSGAGGVYWVLEYTWSNINDTFTDTSSTATTTTVSGVPYKQLVTDFPPLNGAGKTISSILMCRLVRAASHGSDTYPDDVAFLAIDFHHEIDAPGSRQEYVK